mmetsp:Transcript_9663/g.14707  ORF Transcript_9663/g.14707 Transcript_9663/m.14707 type:complete len:143 (+) Transcript_9663:1153-1581(+)
MSDAELRKIEELRKLKAAKLTKKEEVKEEVKIPVPQMDSLPALMMGGGRKGAFEVPDFLKKNVQADLVAVGEKDMFDEVLKKQDKANEESGMSMAEIARKKREEAEKVIQAKGGVPTNNVNDRKAHLQEIRERLRKQKEDKR